VAGAFGPGRRGGFAPGGQGGQGPAFGGGPGGFPFGRLGPGAQGGTGGAFPGGGGTRGGLGGLLNGGTPSSELVSLLRQGADGYSWAAATVGSNSAAGIQLATGEPIMAIGGFNGSDPAPTLEQFQQYVSEGRIHYFLSGGGGLGGGGFRGGGLGGPGGGSGAASQIASWVEQSFSAQTVGGVTVYDLTSASGATGT
jgi:hypothetical protein